jgi:hypothetical protein
MRYLLLICGEGVPVEDEIDEDSIDWTKETDLVEPWLQTMASRNVRLIGSRLAEPNAAVTIRRRDGELLRTDGPYAETKEWIAGFDLIECENIEEAVEIAASHPVADFGVIEIRPLAPQPWMKLRPYPGRLG